MIRFLRRLVGCLNYMWKTDRRNRIWPMNGQSARLELVRQVIRDCQIARFTETGTHLGDTAVWFAAYGLPMITIEINPRWCAFCRLRLRKYKNVEVREGHSVDVLSELISEPIDHGARTLFYLDAHWLEYLPLREELELIAAHFPKAVVLIDDFEVPGDPGYGFDDYGPGKRLSLEYLDQSGMPRFSVYFPSTASRNETGRRRGCVLLTRNPTISATLDRLKSLRRYK